MKSGIRVPAWFRNEIKGIDRELHLVYHPFRVLYDDVINGYNGSSEDPRFNIHMEHGHEVWGFVLTTSAGAPIPEHKYHIWRRQWPHGYCHVIRLDSLDEGHLSLLLSRLHLQANIASSKKYQRKLAEEAEEKRIKDQKATQDMMDDVQEENKWLLKKALENADRGIVNPTNPTKDQIISYPGQGNRSRIIRPLDDTEGGLIIPEHWRKPN